MLMKNIYIIILLYTITIQCQTQYPKNFFSNPVGFKMAIAGTFGELRSNHFHSGIDVKTKQTINLPIYAAQDGYVSRIKVSSFGFGKAIYITHQNGYTTVYAHLENFNKKIQNITEKKQYEIESFEVDFSLQENEIKINNGEVIGYSGNTGSSTAPHLHFEIRDTKTQQVINPMLFGLPILDRTHPTITSILIYHNNGRKEVIPTKQISENKYILQNNPTIQSPFNIGINTYDLLDAAPNKNGIYAIDLYVNDTLFFSNKMTKFSFSETKYINTHIDYEYYKNSGLKFQKCFLDFNNNISTNIKNTTSHIGHNPNSHNYKIKIIVQDSYNNKTTLEFEAYIDSEKNTNTDNKSQDPLINCKQVFEFKNTDCEIYLPNNSLYKNHMFTYQKMNDTISQFPIYKIMDDSIPIHKNFILSIRADSIDKDLREKAIIMRSENNKLFYIKSKWKDNKIIGKSNKLGYFTIALDTINPTIKQVNENELNTLQFKIKDELSGIKEYRGEIDGKWILMEYDFKTNILKHIFKKPPQKKHQKITLSVSDNVDNHETIEIEFYR